MCALQMFSGSLSAGLMTEAPDFQNIADLNCDNFRLVEGERDCELKQEMSVVGKAALRRSLSCEMLICVLLARCWHQDLQSGFDEE